MIKVIFWSYYFLHMWKKVQNYVNKCDLCHKIKLSRYKLYREIRTVLTSDWPWALVVIDFIIKLLLSKKLLTEVIYNLILIIVDWLMKKVRFLSYKEASDAEELTYTFLQNVISLQELTNKIISDRDKLFILRFWIMITRQLELSHKLSTVYHLQINKQMKQINQVIK